MKKGTRFFGIIFLISLALSWFCACRAVPTWAATWYVSSSQGSDGHDGTSESTPFQTVAKINSLALNPGDRVLFRCGDVWRADPLVIVRSGSADNYLTFGSYPENCRDRPVLSGSFPIYGWSAYENNIYSADLSAGGNSGRFPLGLNQLFKNGGRLPFGRWPNIDAPGGGYSFVDEQPSSTSLTDYELPARDWTGAVVHIMSMRWLIFNRRVESVSGQTLNLGADTGCWGGSCRGWGYFLNNHLKTLDREGEWYYDPAAGKVYLYSAAGPPADGEIEGSVILDEDADFQGAVILGRHLYEAIHYVIIENFEIVNWFANGVTTPRNWQSEDNSHLIIRNNHIRNVESIGLQLAAWVWQAADGVNGWRGGHDLEIAGNIIDGANHFGLTSYAYNSHYHDNVIKNIGLTVNLGRSGLGCGYTGTNCTENGDGFRIKLDDPGYSAHHNLVEYNRLDHIGYCGMDIFGAENHIRYNVIKNACYTKGDCGGIRTFGADNLDQTDVYDLIFENNIILDTIGNTDAASQTYKDRFGLGLYIDHYSKNVTARANTIVNSTVTGLLYQNSTGTIFNNVLYNNSSGSMYSDQIGIYSQGRAVTAMTGNILYGLKTKARTLSVSDSGVLTGSGDNYFFNPYWEKNIQAEGGKTLDEWRSYSGQDMQSKKNWFNLAPGVRPWSFLFYNDTKSTRKISLKGGPWYDLDQNEVSGEISLAPFTSRILITPGGYRADLSWLGLLLD